MRDDGGREGGKEGEERCAKGGEKEGGCPHSTHVQTVVALICSISTITGPASSLVVIRAIFTRTKELQRAKKKEKEEKEKTGK